MPIGYLVTIGVISAGMLASLVPFARSGGLGTLSWLLSAVVNESPSVAVYWLLLVTLLAAVQGDMTGPAAWVAFGVGCASLAAAPVLIARALRGREVLDRALHDGLGPEWRHAAATRSGGARRDRLPWARILLTPIPVSRRGVRRTANLSYGPHGRRNRLDVYRRRGQSEGAPILIHLHGGGFRSGRKSFYARALLHEFAREGWVCISASYRLRPQAAFQDFVVDVKRVIAWAREHAPEQEADPGCIVLAGSSAGAHLAVTAALTAHDPTFQPGFEDCDTSVAAAIGLYGYYGRIEAGPQPSSPMDYVHPGAPPLLVAHGGQDTFVPPDLARQLAERVRAVSSNPVVHAELPGAQHSFDLVRSVRFEILIDGLQAFASWVRLSSKDEASPRPDPNLPRAVRETSTRGLRPSPRSAG